MNSKPQQPPAFARWDWLGPIHVALLAAVILLLYRRSRRRDGRSLWSPSLTRADLIVSLKADLAVAVIEALRERYLPQVPSGRELAERLTPEDEAR